MLLRPTVKGWVAIVRFQSAIVALALGTHLLLRNEREMSLQLPCSPADWTAAEAASASFTGVSRKEDQPLPLLVTLRLQLPLVTRRVTRGGGGVFETVLHLVYAHKCEPVLLGTGTQAYMHKHAHGVAHSLDAPANSYTFSSRQNSVLGIILTDVRAGSC